MAALHESTRTVWTEQKDRLLMRKRLLMTDRELAEVLHTSVASIRGRARALGLRKGERRVWPAHDIAYLKSAWGKQPIKQIEAILDRTLSSILHKASRLGLRIRKNWRGIVPSHKVCEECTKPFTRPGSLSHMQFLSMKCCSRRCAGKHKTGIPTGVVPSTAFEKAHVPWNKGKPYPAMQGRNNPKWKPRVLTDCPGCRKTWITYPYRVRDYPHGNYCSRRCMMISRLQSGEFPKRTGTDIEETIKAALIRRGYAEGRDFFHQYRLANKFLCDFVFPKARIVIECDGDWHHANPAKYKRASGLHPIQVRQLGYDRGKNAYIRKMDSGSWTLLRFWGTEIMMDARACVDKIEAALKSKKKECDTTERAPQVQQAESTDPPIP